ncbi:hypothetical protein COLO4_14547 [Corchorus olitorius]|uniref:ATP binding protein n=1 Tax=Corchorus olitorius TaxID=93759 RepID=A0A1R3JRZ3_9ROSI|nr:hypothetical protein COLO4_14547 [Corchorus olitorius]
MVMKERDEELALFLEMRRREKEKEMNNNLFLLNQNSEQLNAPLGSNVNVNGNGNGNAGGGGGSPISKIVSAVPVRKTAADNFLNSENDKSDYDWLLTPPGTPLFPSLEKESQKTLMSQIGLSTARPTALKTRLANLPEEPASKSTLAPKQQNSSPGLNSSTTLNKRPSSSGGPKSSSRPATPTGRPTLPTANKPVRSSTPTSRATLPSAKPAASTARSSTPTRSTARSSTPTARPSLPSSKPASRSATPTRRPANASNTPTTSATTGRSSSVTRSASTTSSAPKSAPTTSSVIKSAPISSSVIKSTPATSSVTKSALTTSRNSAPSRGTSPTVKSRPWKPSDMPGFSLDTPPNLRTSLPERPVSASRGRPGAPSSRSSSVDTSSNGRARRQSCSPARSRPSNGSVSGNGSSIRSGRRVDTSGSDNESPVVIGTKMVERVVNMRKLMPPKHDDNPRNNPTAKLSSSLDSSGFGRTLSKKSLDMAMRHMDIRRIAGNPRPLMTNVPASSIYSVRSTSTKSRTASVTDSPLATSSNASSEPSVNNNPFCIDGMEMEDNDLSSERGNSSPTSQRAS